MRYKKSLLGIIASSSVMVVGYALTAECQAEVVLINGTSTAGEERDFISGIGIRRTRMTAFKLEADTVADTARLTDVTFTYEGLNRTVVRNIPGNFPNPPITITEKITFDPISAPTSLLSSTTRPITSTSSGFRSNISFDIGYPTSITYSGVYELHGPTESAVVPFSVQFNSLGLPPRSAFTLVEIVPGSNFPTSATASALAVDTFSPLYDPNVAVLFEGTIDGVQFTRRFGRMRLWGNNNVPEPSGLALGAIAVAATFRRRRGQREILS